MIPSEQFISCVADIKDNKEVLKMKKFIQHYDTNCYDHCYEVAFLSFSICKKLHLDYRAAARAGFLHDLFLYDWHIKGGDNKRLHGLRHPYIALKNSLVLFNLSKKEQDIIKKHMWPLTVIPPRYLESYVVSFVDKYCAIAESVRYYKENIRLQKFYRYAYLFFGLMIFRSM